MTKQKADTNQTLKLLLKLLNVSTCLFGISTGWGFLNIGGKKKRLLHALQYMKQTPRAYPVKTLSGDLGSTLA